MWSCAASVFADDGEVVAVRLDFGISGAVRTQIFTKHAHRHRHHLLRIGNRSQRLTQPNHELVFLLSFLSLRNVGGGADDLPHRAVFISSKDLVATVKPA